MAYPIGGEGNPQYIILEMHYDNPTEISGLSIVIIMNKELCHAHNNLAAGIFHPLLPPSKTFQADINIFKQEPTQTNGAF